MSAQTKRPGDRLAFPAPYEPYGLTKRELFAAMAMQGLLSNAGGPYQASEQSGWRIVNCTQKQVAQECVDMADALIAELAKDGAP